ncbi:MAG: response regulator [Desulfobacterales bacterium]|nr:response regulator [Desulfobacterales bacterium]
MRIGRIPVKKEQDILKVRRAVKSLSKAMGFEYLDCIRVTTAASELTRNIYEHATGGEILLEVVNGRGFRLIFRDKGRGIKDVDEVMSGIYQSEKGMGIGLLGAKKLMDDFEIDSRPGEGATITTVKWLGGHKALSATQVEKLKMELAALSEESALESLKAQNRELVEVLGELKNSNSQLAAVNRELEMTNAGIVSLYQEIDKKNEELQLKDVKKTEFLRTMGHETRTPINSVLTLSGMLMRKMDGDLSPEQEKQVTMIKDSAQHLLTLINDLLDLSKIEAGMVALHVSMFSMNDLFQHVSSTMMPLAEKKGLTLEFDCEEKLPEIESDFKSVVQVLLNLVGNAVKFTDKGGIEVVAAKETVSDQDCIKVAVHDTGMGIAKDKLKEVFEEFKQAHSRDDIPKGTGLGLPITKKLLEHLGGDITVESEAGKGSTFSFSLPVAFRKEKKAPARLKVQKGDLIGDAVLIVEDDEKMIYSLRKSIESAGYSVLVARTSEQALSLAALHPIFAVCLDILLPEEKDGWTTLKALKRNPKTRQIPILVITVLGDAADKAEALGADEYMEKPIDMDELIGRLQKYRKGKRFETILVVDDEEPEVMGLKTYLGQDYRILTAYDGQQALEVVEKEEPDLILLDLIMPVMDGFEFLKRLRKDKKHMATPVIVYSSKDLSREEKAVLSRDALQIIKKSEAGIEETAVQVRKILNMLGSAGL